ncbi:MAG: uroporphyrinogen III synthase [Alteromonadaceae bacterium]|nr:uroporphyrinogen III synthase [Alteromonadaceae bacterium]MBH85328.1 uroporphyrinogen III synthase [Alteromonadaceae bacterium]
MASTSSNATLAGMRILICRPQPDADRVALALQAAGAETHCLPMLTLAPTPDTPERRSRIQELAEYQHVIAVSPGAARAFLEYADDWWPQWPVGLHWYGVGSGTAEILRHAGLTVTTPANGYTSEHLLSVPALAAPAGERVLIAKGAGGRELLGRTLRERGARVDDMVLYQRTCPEHDAATMTAALTDFDPHAIIVLSAETLNNLIALGKNTDKQLMQRTLVVPVPQVAEQAQKAGFARALVPDQLTPEGLTQCLTALPSGTQHTY